MNETKNNMNDNGLIGIIKILWKYKKMIVIGTMGVTIIAIIVSLLLPKIYLSKAVISLSSIKKGEQDDLPKSMEIPMYRRYADTFQSRALFMKYSRMKGYKQDWGFGDFETEEQFFESHLSPIYAFETEKPGVKVVENSIMGIKIEGEEDSPQKARMQAEILGSYLLTTILNAQIGQYIETTRIKSLAAIVQDEKSLINLERETGYLKEKETLIVQHLLKLPGTGNQPIREVVTADANSEKYLSPQQQLVSVKMSIKENEIQMNRVIRNKKIDQLILQYIERINKLVLKETEYLIDENLLDSLIAEKNKFFSGKSDNESKMAGYTISGQFFLYQQMRSVVYKFISNPTLPERHFRPKRKRIVLGVFFFGFFIFSSIAFLLEVWGANKKRENSIKE